MYSKVISYTHTHTHTHIYTFFHMYIIGKDIIYMCVYIYIYDVHIYILFHYGLLQDTEIVPCAIQ